MPNSLFYAPRPQFFKTELGANVPNSNGTLEFYSAGTTSLKEVYSTRQGSTPLENPLPLDPSGYVPEGGVWYGVGTYKVICKNSEHLYRFASRF